MFHPYKETLRHLIFPFKESTCEALCRNAKLIAAIEKERVRSVLQEVIELIEDQQRHEATPE